MFLCLCLPSLTQAQTRRALLIGSNIAPPGLTTLKYAHEDARKLKDVLIELGGMESENIDILLDPNAETFRTAIKKLRSHSEDKAQLIFYYSGHADESGLRLGNETIPLSEIREFLNDPSAQVRLAILDSCESGAASRLKGGTMRPGVDIRFSFDPAVMGAVLITSSAAEEASIERDDLGGSIFTHFFVSGLRGGADVNQDGQVSLEEAFRYSYDHTLARSAESRAGTQHPTYEYRIAGQRQLVLSWLDLPSFMTFGKRLAGSYVVFDRGRDQVVAELTKAPGVERKLWLPTGDYFIKKRLENAVLIQKITLGKGAAHEVKEHEMHTVPYEEDVTKGRRSRIFESNWKYGAPYTDKTAFTLRRGELNIGLQKIEYGVTDNISFSISPLKTIFLSPSISNKYRLYQGDYFGWALQTSMMQSYYYRLFKNAQRSTFEFGIGTIGSWSISPEWTVSVNAGWKLSSGPDETKGEDFEWETQNATGGANLLWALTEDDVLQLSGEAIYTVIAPQGTGLAGKVSWTATVMYAHRWGALRTGLGLSYSNKTEDFFGLMLPITPVFDIWWRW